MGRPCNTNPALKVGQRGFLFGAKDYVLRARTSAARYDLQETRMRVVRSHLFDKRRLLREASTGPREGLAPGRATPSLQTPTPSTFFHISASRRWFRQRLVQKSPLNAEA